MRFCIQNMAMACDPTEQGDVVHPALKSALVTGLPLTNASQGGRTATTSVVNGTMDDERRQAHDTGCMRSYSTVRAIPLLYLDQSR